MNVYFRSPELNGGCLFDSYVYAAIELPSGDRLVFRAPMHENGGCIFADPSEIQVLRTGGSGSRWEYLFREDEEIIAVIMAATLRRGYGGIIGV